MRYREKLNIAIIRDNGPRRTFQLRRSNFFLLLILFACLPFLCLLLAIQCWLFWEENFQLRESLDRAEAEYQEMESRAERLESLEYLLKEENVPGREILIRQLAETSSPAEDASEENSEETSAPPVVQPDFESIDTGKINISNVQTRILRGHVLRISLDLRNPVNDSLVSGEVEAFLVMPNGETKELIFSPRESGLFRIARFKRTVLSASPAREELLAASQIILEVKEHNGPLIFRNLYPINQ